MRNYLLRRLAQAVVVVFGVIVLTFVVARVVPGDPAVAYAGPHATPQALAQVRHEFGLDEPALQQLGDYLKGTLTGDWGTALHTHRPVLDDLGNVIPPTLELVGFAMLLALVVGIPLGMIAARRGGASDAGIRLGTMLSVSAPVFLLALGLQYIFATKLSWFPVAGEYDPKLDYTHPLTVYTHMTVIDALVGGNFAIFGSALAHLILPAIAVAAYPTGVIAQMTRASLIEQLGEDHVRMARGLGYSERQIVRRLALRPALNPVVSVTALMFAYALVNTFLVESIFNWPGLGSYATASIQALDTPAIIGVTLFVAIVYVIATLVVDVVQAWLDPRVSLS
ncbi:ABC transporter permease [Conexibacter woesei]|uniref:ABC transporter permease n=1 Tax=Conexibacter woesei TaxID=191495 RepID=UPI00042798AE|nr:ABC transporter permease [Conexibacter woesei]